MKLPIALACCALAACKGKSEDEREPAQAPVQPSPPADAAAPDAAPPCVDFRGLEGEKHGIRRIAHHATQATAPKEPRPKDVVLLEVGKPTRVPALDASEDLVIPPLGADALVTMAKFDERKHATLTAPAHLEGAVLRVRGTKNTLVAIGPAGLATYARYRANYEKARKSVAGLAIKRLTLMALVHEDIDHDGTPEQVSLAYAMGAGDPQLELGILWADGNIAFARWSELDEVIYIAPPSLSGGAPLLFTALGDRAVLKDRTLDRLEPVLVVDGCLQTSATEPARLAPSQ